MAKSGALDKGYIQLAMRTGQYRCLNAGIIHEGVKVHRNILFRKTLYMTYAEVVSHAKRYSKSFSYESSAWQTNFDEMALKTVIRRLLSKYGILTTEIVTALTSDKEEDVENEVEAEIEQNANKEFIDIEPEEVEEQDEAKDEREQKELEQQQMSMEGPGF